jgi:F-type H+-transporting ATPase subunit a
MEHVSILRSANSDLNIPIAMALIVFFYSEFLGFKTGGLAYAKEFIWPGMLIEIISHLARPVALSLRLFGNILAGEILLTVVSGLVGILIPALFMGFELFVGIVQALIFSLLTLAFLSMSTAHAAHHELAEEAGEGVTHH